MARPQTYKTAREQILTNITEDINGCWLWSGTKLGIKGYACVKGTGFGKKYKVRGAHQLSYIAFNGEYGRKLMICHICNIRHCVNPDHLYAGTARDNQRDKALSGSVKGSKNPFALLTEEKVIEIKKLIKLQLTDGAIGLMYGTDKSNINLIRNNKTWRHVQ